MMKSDFLEFSVANYNTATVYPSFRVEGRYLES